MVLDVRLEIEQNPSSFGRPFPLDVPRENVCTREHPAAGTSLFILLLGKGDWGSEPSGSQLARTEGDEAAVGGEVLHELPAELRGRDRRPAALGRTGEGVPDVLQLLEEGRRHGRVRVVPETHGEDGAYLPGRGCRLRATPSANEPIQLTDFIVIERRARTGTRETYHSADEERVALVVHELRRAGRPEPPQHVLQLRAKDHGLQP